MLAPERRTKPPVGAWLRATEFSLHSARRVGHDYLDGLESIRQPLALLTPVPGPQGLRLSNVQEPQDYANFESYQADARTRHFNLWTYIDARDAAQAVRLSIEAKLTGAHVFGIANANSLMRRSNDSLLDEIWPGVPRKRPLQPNESLISIEKAQRLLGYRPRYDWKG